MDRGEVKIMKLTIRQIVIAGPTTIEREIYLEEDNPLHQAQVMSPQPPQQPIQDPFKEQIFEGIVGSNTVQDTDLSFPLLVMLISKVFEGGET